MLASTQSDPVDLPRSRPFSVTPAIELTVLAAAIAVGVASYLVVTGERSPGQLLAPPLVALLLVANLVPDMALIVLFGRRVARRRAARSPVGGEGQLHVRLVALFSVVAAVPMLLVAIAASLLFQYGVQFWYSDRVGEMLSNANALTRSSYNQTLQRWEEATVTMAGDLAAEMRVRSLPPAAVYAFLGQQLYFRSLSEGALIRALPGGTFRLVSSVNPYGIDPLRQLDANTLPRLRGGQRSAVSLTNDRIQTVTLLPGSRDMLLYTARVVPDPGQMQQQIARADAVIANYQALLLQARSLQLQFNAALLLLSLLIVGIAVWIALKLADRLVRPVGELVDAARRVTGGDLTARVPDPRSRDEVGTLAKAFNRMTARLQEQNGALVAANDQLEGRRALIEAVMGGVSAGVVATGEDGVIRIANRSASQLLGTGDDGVVGHRLADVAPELHRLALGTAREATAQVRDGAEAKTLAVRIARIEAGPILTFDDITQQLNDQRRAAWSDVARRIAHEIKNPLTPIQLAAERLQRRYGGKVEEGDTVFARLTDTIVRQVGDLRRMVDEFSSFARMPKPVFRREALADLARQALFLHEVAHPGIRFRLHADDPAPTLVCDRRQIGQALTNLVKNAVEAIEAREGEGGEVVLSLAEAGGRVTVAIADDGVGLPAERDRILEPYMTTRARGTGLGLAIVKKIVEEHAGTIGFSDRQGGGTRVTVTFDATALAALDLGPDVRAGDPDPMNDGPLTALTRNRI